MPSSLHARKTRMAISPRFAHMTFFSGTMAIGALERATHREPEGPVRERRRAYCRSRAVAMTAQTWDSRSESDSPPSRAVGLDPSLRTGPLGKAAAQTAWAFTD